MGSIRRLHWNTAAGKVLIGSVGCDFGAVQSIRRFTLPPPDTGDTGWIFQFPDLVNADGTSTTPAKAYLKFKKDLDGGDVDGNWNYVNSHLLRIHIVGVVKARVETVGSPADLARYAYVVNSAEAGTPANAVPYTDMVLTGLYPNSQNQRDGAAQSIVKAGDQIAGVDDVLVGADELTQYAY